MSFVKKVLEFNRIAGQTNEFNPRNISLYVGLVLEEVEELIASIPDDSGGDLGRLKVALDWNSRRFKQGDFDHLVERVNKVEALDACVDISVVSIGCANALGADVEGACNEVAESNLSKFPVGEGGQRVVLKDENGKIRKPESYRPPQLAQFL